MKRHLATMLETYLPTFLFCSDFPGMKIPQRSGKSGLSTKTKNKVKLYLHELEDTE